MISVSVAVITYNMEKYLRPLLESILTQKVDFEYEIVIDDDHSPDGSRGIICEYEMRYPGIVHPIYRDKNIGGSRNMFGVMNACKGKYIAILEGDDWWEDDSKLQYEFDFLETHPEYVGMCMNSWCDHGIEPEYKDVMRRRTEPKVFTFTDFQTRHFHSRLPSSTDTWMFRNFFHDGGDYSIFFEAHNMVWDQPLALILYSKGSVYADPKLVSHHRSVVKKGGTNYQSLVANRNMLADDDRMYSKMEEYITGTLHRECGDFALARADTWLDAYFRALKTKNNEDKRIARLIWKNQPNKLLYVREMTRKVHNIAGRKIRSLWN